MPGVLPWQKPAHSSADHQGNSVSLAHEDMLLYPIQNLFPSPGDLTPTVFGPSESNESGFSPGFQAQRAENAGAMPGSQP